jgi:hypothetical protein
MQLPVAFALTLAHAVTPIGIAVETRDGVRRLVPIADADLLPTEVCVADGSVCAPVVVEGGEHVSRVDVDEAAGLRFVVRGTRTDTRSHAPAAIAIGLGVAAVGASAAALTATAIGAGVDTVSSTGADTAAAASTMSLAMWVGAGVAATSAAVIGVVAIGEAFVVDEAR